MKWRRHWKPVLVGLLLLVAGGGLGTWAEVAVHGYLEDRGCLNLAVDVVPPPDFPARAEPLRFLALGDVGTGTEEQRRVARTAARLCREPGCDFLLLLGDNFYPAGVTSPADPLFQRVYEDVYGPIGKPVFAVLGNHDVAGNSLAQVLHTLQSRTWRMPNFNYGFRAGPAHFRAINTNCKPLSLWGLGEELAGDGEGWSFLIGHHTVYGNGPHGDTDRQTRWYWERAIAPHVDFYLSGHDHQLAHLRTPGGKTDYVVSGAGGETSRDLPPEAFHTSTAESLFRYPDNGLVAFEVTAARVRVRYYDADGAVLHEFVREKP